MLPIISYSAVGATLTVEDDNFCYPACGPSEILYLIVVLSEPDVILEALQ